MIEDRPDAVYVPTHIEGMQMVGTTAAGPYRVALFYSFPHRFWTVSGTDTSRVSVGRDDSMHLMVSLRDAETGVALPVGNVSIGITRDGETIEDRRPWAMLSQRMGFHFGDNVALPAEDPYEVAVGVDPPAIRRTGAFRDRFGSREQATFSLEFERRRLADIRFRRLEDTRGQRGAVEPMSMDGMAPAQLSPPDDLRGRTVGETTTGDGRFVASILDVPPAGIEGPGPYLAVSARTPYNRYPLSFMSLSATVRRDGETRFDGPLVPTLDPGLGYHYGVAVGTVEPGDTIELDAGAPPQVARHEGYETAFFDMDPMALAVP